MSCNISSGGLIAAGNGLIFVSDLESFNDTLIIDRNGNVCGNIPGFCWFMTNFRDDILYSNQKANNHLYKYNIQYDKNEILLDIPCNNLRLLNSSLLFINESDGKLYEYHLISGKTSKLIDEKVNSFVLSNSIIYYSTAGSLKQYDMDSRRIERICEAMPVSLSVLPNRLIFSNKNTNYTMNILDIPTKKLFQMSQIVSKDIVTDDHYIYCINYAEDMSIFRIDLANNNIIRICGDRADRLHIIENHIYYCNLRMNNSWYKMPLGGGQPIKVTRQV